MSRPSTCSKCKAGEWCLYNLKCGDRLQAYNAGLEAAALAFEPLRVAVEAGQVIAWDSRRLVAHVQETIRALKDPHTPEPAQEDE